MVQGGEWIVIVLVALVVFGPERLPELSRKLGGWARELRNAAREMREGLEAEVSEVQKAKADLTDPVKEVRQAVRDTARLASETNPTRLEWKGPKPLSGPTPDQAMADLDRIEAGDVPVDEPLANEATAVPIDEPPVGGQPDSDQPDAGRPKPGSEAPTDRSTDASEEAS
jgi:sec-independent protein translocase protein TatB